MANITRFAPFRDLERFEPAFDLDDFWRMPSMQALWRGFPQEPEGEKVVRSERYYGKQYRSFSLRHDIDQAKAQAKYEDGVLELTLPKKETTHAKELTVK